jgi:hypothetical protein
MLTKIGQFYKLQFRESGMNFWVKLSLICWLNMKISITKIHSQKFYQTFENFYLKQPCPKWPFWVFLAPGFEAHRVKILG